MHRTPSSCCTGMVGSEGLGPAAHECALGSAEGLLGIGMLGGAVCWDTVQRDCGWACAAPASDWQ